MMGSDHKARVFAPPRVVAQIIAHPAEVAVNKIIDFKSEFAIYLMPSMKV